MNTFPSTKTLSRCLLGAALMALGASTALQAADLDARIQLRPLTPQEIKDYSLTDAQRSGGLNTVGIGQPGYVDVLVNLDVLPSDNVTVSFVVTNEFGIMGTLESSPLGTSIPPYNIEDRPGGRMAAQVAGRTMFRPEFEGEYTVVATVNSLSNTPVILTQEITAATYMGRDTCALCHSGGAGDAPNTWGWAETGHATAFTRKIDGIGTTHFGPNCISCHVVGYDSNTNAVNGGWDDVAAEVNWEYPPNAVSNNWEHMDPALQNVSNIQCESCHGPGSQHAYSLGQADKISVSLAPGNCAQCHDSLTHHYKTAEYNVSKHGSSVSQTRSSCARCHESQGFVNFAAGEPAVNVEHTVISCGACHDAHDATNPHQIRTLADVTLMDSSNPGGATVVTEGGNGKLCMQCHISRRDAVTYVEDYHSHYGPHHGPQTDMLVGANAITYDRVIPSSSHYSVVEDTCATCHMQPLHNGDEGFTDVGGHTFNLTWSDGTNTIEMVEACIECHGEIESFDFPRKDYDEDGVIEGVQTEVHGLMEQLGMLLPPYGSADVVDDPDWTSKELKAAYNYLFVEEDGSHGAHNLSYTVGILKASIQDLKGNPKAEDANSDGLPDAWQVEHFDSIYSPYAARNFAPAGDDMPNWLKYSLGLDPWTAVEAIPDGYVYAQGKQLGGTDDTLYIYTAAEIAFDTEVGKTYQIQETSEISAGWQDIGGDPIVGTGNAVSYITPTRGDVQQYFRVVITP